MEQSGIFTTMKESVKIDTSVVNKVRRYVKKTKQTIGGFFELAAFSLLGDEKIKEVVEKAKKWDDLDDKIAPFYDENDEGYNDEGGLITIGEIAATAFGYL